MKFDHAVVIVGGGWAGLSAAVELVRHEVPVILLESARQLGGRARCVHAHDLRLDNGQHLLLGAYESTLDLLRSIGVDETRCFLRYPLSLQWRRPGDKMVHLRTPRLPAPLHLAWALFTAQGLGLRERLAALRFAHAQQRGNFSLAEDCSVAELLRRHNQPPALIEAIWEPLCLGALNTRLHEASAKIFLRTLKDSFRRRRRDSDLLLTRTDLGGILPEPARDFIESRQGSVRLGQRVTRLHLRDERLCGIELGDTRLNTQHLILATPAIIARRLLSPHTLLQPLATQLEHLEFRPICTVYLQYTPETRLPRLLSGLLGGIGQWVFDRRLYGQSGLMAVVISGDGEHMKWGNDTLCDTIVDELATLFPHWPQPLWSHPIREKRATFASNVGIDQYRPGTKTPVTGLWLAGDYTDTGLPATLEGAVRSGLSCAQRIMKTSPPTGNFPPKF